MPGRTRSCHTSYRDRSNGEHPATPLGGPSCLSDGRQAVDLNARRYSCRVQKKNYVAKMAQAAALQVDDVPPEDKWQFQRMIDATCNAEQLSHGRDVPLKLRGKYNRLKVRVTSRANRLYSHC